MLKVSIETYKIALSIAIKALNQNRFRSLLTALGIIFGVAAVIAMMGIISGSRQEVLDQIKLVGVNNIIISKKISNAEDDEEETKKGGFSPGLSKQDLVFIEQIPSVKQHSPVVSYNLFTLQGGKGFKIKSVGVDADYFDMFNVKLISGKLFSKEQQRNSLPVCVLGLKAKAKLFSTEDPIGKKIKCGDMWLTVIGVVNTSSGNAAQQESIAFKNDDMSIFIPYTTLLLREKDRSVLTEAILKRNNEGGGDDGFGMGSENKAQPTTTDHNQFDQIIVQVSNAETLQKTANIISRNLERNHNKIIDFEIQIPELLLEQQQKSKDIFNVVLGVIASISLLIGGIGIMNIMLASVMERVKEIGLRAALGATRNDLILQFLFESVLISFGGGIIGIVIGVSIAKVISVATGIKTIITLGSILVSFFVAVFTGLIFGITPAKRAADQNPIESLRN